MLVDLILDENKETVIGELDLDELTIHSINALYSGIEIEFPTGMTIKVKGVKLNNNHDIEALYVEEL